MNTICIHDKDRLEAFFRKDVYLNIYSIGDLDDFFWPYTTWYALEDNEELQAVALVYTGVSRPNVIALSQDTALMRRLLREIIPILPSRFDTHLSFGLEDLMAQRYEMESHGKVHKMALRHPDALNDVDCSRVVRLSGHDLDTLQRFYSESYPGNWFDPRMLETNQYFGVRESGTLVSVAGVHVFSKRYKVAALGNIATHPDHINKGCGKAVTARLCQSLREHIDHIGLNVKADNHAAIACYRSLGFDTIAPYDEFTCTLKTIP